MLLYRSNFTATLFVTAVAYPKLPPPEPSAAVEPFCSVNVNPSAVCVPADVWKLKSVVKFWIFTGVGYQALDAWNVPLVVVKDKAVPLMKAFPFSAIEPDPKPLPKPTPEELTVNPLMAVALWPSVSVITTLCPPTMAVEVIESVAVIFVAEL